MIGTSFPNFRPLPVLPGEGRRVLGIAFILLSLCASCAGETSTTRPWPGITLERDVLADPPTHFYVVTIDLTNPHIHLVVSRGGWSAKLTAPWETTLLPVSLMAKRDGLTLAVNGNLFASKEAPIFLGRKVPYFVGNWARCCGWAMSDGVLYSRWPLEADWHSLVVSDSGRVSIGEFTQLPEDARQVVSGVWQIVTDGQITADPDTNETTAGRPAPHTVVGIDRDGRTLTILVVDGRRAEYSLGMGRHRMAEEMLARGAWNALVLDGGGSTTLVLRDREGNVHVVNRPSDGHDLPVAMSVERSVANALGVIVDGAATRPGKQ
jgi:exopolysaccharide biosynthesis protein